MPIFYHKEVSGTSNQHEKAVPEWRQTGGALLPKIPVITAARWVDGHLELDESACVEQEVTQEEYLQYVDYAIEMLAEGIAELALEDMRALRAESCKTRIDVRTGNLPV